MDSLSSCPPHLMNLIIKQLSRDQITWGQLGDCVLFPLLENYILQIGRKLNNSMICGFFYFFINLENTVYHFLSPIPVNFKYRLLCNNSKHFFFFFGSNY